MTERREDEAAPRADAKDGRDAERIAKVLARAGLCSRREAEDWVTAGRVAVNGRVLESPAFTVTPTDVVTIDGKPLPTKERTRLWLFHKPRGLVTTNQDPEGRPTVFSVLPEDMPRVVTVGRLDINTEGLLLLTNDGGVARVLELPSTGWLRRYRVRAFGHVEASALEELSQGISLDGVDYGPIEAMIERVQGANTWLVLGLREGKNREVKRVLAALGLTVNRLIRVSFGPFQLADLEEGEIREIRGRILRDQLGPRLVAEAGADFDAPIVHHMQGDTDADEGKKRKIRAFERGEETPRGEAGEGARKRPARTHMEFVGTGEKRSRDRGEGAGPRSRGEAQGPRSRGEAQGPRSRGENGGGPRPRSEGFRGRPEGGGERPAKGKSEGFRDRPGGGEGRFGKSRSEGFRDRPGGGEGRFGKSRSEGFRDRPGGGEGRFGKSRSEGFRDRPGGGEGRFGKSRSEGFRDRPGGGRAEGGRDRPRTGEETGDRRPRGRYESDFTPRGEGPRGEVRPPRGGFASEGFRGRPGGGEGRSEGGRGRGREADGERPAKGRAEGFRDRPEGGAPKKAGGGFGPRGPRGMNPGGRKGGFEPGPKGPRGGGAGGPGGKGKGPRK